MAAPDGEQPSAGPIAVLLADLPGLFAEVLTAMIQRRSDLGLAGVFDHNPEALALAVASAQVLVVGVAPDLVGVARAASYRPLLRLAPNLRIIALETSEDMADLYWLGLYHRRQSIQSLEQFADIVLDAVAIDPYAGPPHDSA